MSDPTLVTCLLGRYTKVATNIIKGTIYKTSNSSFLYTYRKSGESAPTDKAEGVPIFLDDASKKLWERSTGVDIYLWAIDVEGTVRIDSLGFNLYVFDSCVRGVCDEDPDGTYNLTVDALEANAVIISERVAIESAELKCAYDVTVSGTITLQGFTEPATFYTIASAGITGSGVAMIQGDVSTPGDEIRVLLTVIGENNLGSFTPYLTET